MAEEHIKMQIRIPSELADWLRDEAASQERTMNRQIIFELRKARERASE